MLIIYIHVFSIDSHHPPADLKEGRFNLLVETILFDSVEIPFPFQKYEKYDNC